MRHSTFSDVEALLTDAIRYDSSLERYRPLCQPVAGYYLIERYPAFEEGPSVAELWKAYTRARGLVRRLQARHVRKRSR